MKIIKGFELCKVMGKTMAVPSGELSKTFPGMIKMNEPAADIWRWIEAGKGEEEICELYAETYSVGMEQAKEEVTMVITKMQEAGILEME